ncbi:hypothetical protein ACOSQ3_019245 [Xanthoceras sorbifolium]
MLGTMYKVESIALTQARGRYARIYVDIDLSKPLKGSLKIDGRSIKVEYKNLGAICFKCGRYGHSKEDCMVDLTKANVKEKLNEDSELGEKTVDINPYGPWLYVSYSKTSRNGSMSRIGSNQMTNGKSTINKEEAIEDMAWVIAKQHMDTTDNQANFNTGKKSALVEITNRVIILKSIKTSADKPARLEGYFTKKVSNNH